MALMAMHKMELMVCLIPFVHFLVQWLVLILKFRAQIGHNFMSLVPRIQKWNK